MSVHKPRPTCFDDPKTNKPMIEFPMISGFFLDPMHLIDGGVIKDLIGRIIEKLGSSPKNASKSKAPVVAGLNKCIEVFNTCKILELCKMR